MSFLLEIDWVRLFRPEMSDCLTSFSKRRRITYSLRSNWSGSVVFGPHATNACSISGSTSSADWPRELERMQRWLQDARGDRLAAAG